MHFFLIYDNKNNTIGMSEECIESNKKERGQRLFDPL